MISMKVDVVTNTGTSRVAITPKVQVDFERHYKCGIAQAFGDDMRIEHVYYLAWKASVYAGQTTAQFDAWLDEVLDVEMVEDESGPLDPAQ